VSLYTVVWHKVALTELAQIWTECEERSEVTKATKRIDAELSNDPEIKGADFHGYRLYADWPLRIFYSVLAQDRMVKILNVGHARMNYFTRE
jgi:hypothetical protein